MVADLKGVFLMTLPRWVADKRLIIGFILAHLLLYFTFNNKAVFWYIFTASLLFLISYAIMNEEIEDHASFFTYLSYGILSGLALYAIFWLGNFFIDFFNLPFSKAVESLYKRLSPTHFWHYIALLLVIIPGEEIFWRNFIQKRIRKHASTVASILISAFMYASVQIYSGSALLVFAALVSGLFWGILYAWKRSLPLVIISHLIFDLFLLIIYPLNG